MPFSVAVLCVLCVSVVKTPFAVHPLHGTPALPARLSTTPRTNVTHRSPHVGHRNRPISALRASPNSVRPLKTCIHAIFNVIKCNHLYRQLPSSLYSQPPKNVLNVALQFLVVSGHWSSPLLERP